MRYILKEIGDNVSGSRPVTEQLPSISCNIATALHFFIFFCLVGKYLNELLS
jgi:hypothetical protein